MTAIYECLKNPILTQRFCKSAKHWLFFVWWSVEV